MGNPMSKIRENIAQQKERKQVIEERLHILEQMVQTHLEVAKKGIFAGSTQDQQIHSGTVVELHQQINLTDSKRPSQKIGDTIKDFFSGDLISGLEDIVELGTNGLLGNNSVGQYEQTDMFIVWSDNALIRCDVYYYRWNFVSRGVVDDCEGVLGVLLVKRVIDVNKTTDEVITYEITKAARRSKKADPQKLIAQALTVLRKVKDVQKQLSAS